MNKLTTIHTLNYCLFYSVVVHTTNVMLIVSNYLNLNGCDKLSVRAVSCIGRMVGALPGLGVDTTAATMDNSLDLRVTISPLIP